MDTTEIEKTIKIAFDRLEALDKQTDKLEHQQKRLERLKEKIEPFDRVSMSKYKRMQLKIAVKRHKIHTLIIKLNYTIQELLESLNLLNFLRELKEC